MTKVTVLDSIHSLKQSVDRIIHVVEALPEEVARLNPTEEEWSIVQIVSHITEAIPYWLNEINQLLEKPRKKWGRGIQDEARLAAVSNTGILDLSVLLQELESAKSEVENVLGSLTAEQLAAEAPSRNPRFGTKPLFFIINHLLVEHVIKHEGQIQRNLSKVKN